MSDLQNAKNALDHIIDIARVHFYKPIHIAEILHYHRTHPDNIDINDLESYRLKSRKWRDEVSQRLVGRVSTSSSRYQDDVFNESAVPPHLLVTLAVYNAQNDGVIECYIYQRMLDKWGDLLTAYAYLENATVMDFSLDTFLDIFERSSGLIRSVDKAYEIIVYGLFTTLTYALKATITVSLENPDQAIIDDFNNFITAVLGLSHDRMTQVIPAALYRAGVTNAADRGLDIWTNFGPIVQVKHLRLDMPLATDIAEQFPATRLIIVCKTADAEIIQSILNQLGMQIRAIISQQDLVDWYDLCQSKYGQTLGTTLLDNLRTEFYREFPHLKELDIFLKERDYQRDQLTDIWDIDKNL